MAVGRTVLRPAPSGLRAGNSGGDQGHSTAKGGLGVANVAKVIELVGESPTSWQDAVQNAVSEAQRTIDHITGVEVTNWTATVRDGKVTEYKVDLKLAFGVDPNRR